MNAESLLGHLQNGAVLRSRWEGRKMRHYLTFSSGDKLYIQQSTTYPLLKRKQLRFFQWGVNDGRDYHLTEVGRMADAIVKNVVAKNKTRKGAVVIAPPTPTAESLLRELFRCLNAKTFIQADESSIRFMVQHLKNPPLTMSNRCAMRLTVNEYNQLYDVLERVGEFLRPPQDEP